jgi:hypothetical protein
MPGLRYGRDITDDAAELLRNIDESRRLVGDARTPADRASARSRLSNFEDALRAAYGDRRTAQALAADAYDFTGTFTDDRGNTYSTREPLSESAYRAYRKVAGKVRTVKTVRDDDGLEATNIGRAMGDVRRNPRTPGLSELSRQVSGQGVQNIIDEAANRPRGSRSAPTKRTGQALSKNRGAAGARAAADNVRKEAAQAAKRNAKRKAATAAKRKKPRG